jgi:hypothetical protein
MIAVGGVWLLGGLGLMPDLFSEGWWGVIIGTAFAGIGLGLALGK